MSCSTFIYFNRKSKFSQIWQIINTKLCVRSKVLVQMTNEGEQLGRADLSQTLNLEELRLTLTLRFPAAGFLSGMHLHWIPPVDPSTKPWSPIMSFDFQIS